MAKAYYAEIAAYPGRVGIAVAEEKIRLSRKRVDDVMVEDARTMEGLCHQGRGRQAWHGGVSFRLLLERALVQDVLVESILRLADVSRGTAAVTV
ncbi:hypothetical protein [Mesorhizobium amorphae]|uniref:hypothetical protein n=1 Tax=Mesorhizobium amorphae TaxID=71433 RepID=UPI0024E1560B|nr:hypothetical protein [Mesorhizobium amorphae]